MIRKFLLVIAFCIASYANLNDVVSNMLGSADYNTHKNLVNHIFANRTNFYKNNQVDYVAVSQELENNNLIKLNYGTVQDVEVTFNFSGSPKKSIKNINDILRTFTFFTYITKEEAVINDQVKLVVKLKTAAAISPLKLSQELQSADCRVVDIKREGDYKWSYTIDATNASVYRAEDLISSNQASLRKPTSKPYFVKIANASKVTISSSAGNSWTPVVVFYDNDLNIIGMVEEDSLRSSLKLDVPNNTRFIKIDDSYSLANIKRGFNITKE